MSNAGRVTRPTGVQKGEPQMKPAAPMLLLSHTPPSANSSQYEPVPKLTPEIPEMVKTELTLAGIVTGQLPRDAPREPLVSERCKETVTVAWLPNNVVRARSICVTL
jgi:hypothetical protein